MSKSSIVFCVLFLVCAAQGATILSSVISSITNVQNEVKSTVESTVASIETAAEDALAQLNSLVATLVQNAETIVNDLQTEVDSILSEVDSTVSTLISEVSTTVSTSECLNIVDTLTDTAVSLVAGATSCVTEKVETAYGYVDEIVTEVQSLISELNEILTATDDCVADVSSLSEAGTALACVNNRLAAASLVSASSVSTLTADVAKLTNLIVSLQSDLTTCVVADSISVLATQASAIVEDVQTCVTNLIS